MKVVVLNGGKGTRLGIRNLPKPMVPVGGKPLLERLLERGRTSGFREYVFLNGHLGGVIERYFGDGARYGVSIEHVREAEPLGTAGAVRAARAHLENPFLVIYGDLLLDLDLEHVAACHSAGDAIGTLLVHPTDHPQDSDLVVVNGDRRITRFLPKPHLAGEALPNLASGALYVLDPQALDDVPAAGAPDWGRDVFPAIVAAGRPLKAYRSLEYVKDIGTPERLSQAEADLKSGRVERMSRRRAKPAVFLDRDGVLNAEVDGVYRSEDLVLLDAAGAAVRAINHAGLPAICVTNQPGIAKGLLSAEEMERISCALDRALAADGAHLDGFYYCPHHPERGWPGEVAALKGACACRKPAPGLLMAAAREHHLDLVRSWMVGDSYADVAAAHAAGVKAVLVRTGHCGSDRAKYGCTPDYVAADVAGAVAYILSGLT